MDKISDTANHALLPEQFNTEHNLSNSLSPVSTVTVSDRTRMRVGKTITLPEFSGVDMNIKQFQLRERILDETFKKQKD